MLMTHQMVGIVDKIEKLNRFHLPSKTTKEDTVFLGKPDLENISNDARTLVFYDNKVLWKTEINSLLQPRYKLTLKS